MADEDRDLSQLAGRPTFRDSQAAALLSHWNLFAAVRGLESERDQNWLVLADGAPSWVLKIANAGDPPALIELQQELMRRLGDAELPCPCVRPTADGLPWVRAAGHLAWLIDFLPGRPLAGERDASPAVFRDLGEIVGRSAVALEGFDHPAAHGRHLQWDVRHAEETLELYAGSIRDEKRRALVLTVLEQFRSRIAPVLEDLPQSVIHNDANDHNVLVRDGRVSALLDFGDAVHTVTVNDLAIACAYAMLDRPDPARIMELIVEGHRRHRGLSEIERALLPVFIRVRLATSVAISAYQQGVHPDDAYLSISEAPAWRLLERGEGEEL